ncbi:hypothetical protein [Neobacillus cucumis]|nr:hypothetical protein [Neobacillus cucumis]MBM7652207.1 hypothetical protein [Neobacillus cucumis]MDR4946577.1 hypothetical protein [Neobacillus cucumis]MED4226649.1 hypothetical protein [Neobacillus cucumis]
MNDQQSEEMIKQLRRIADALEHIKSQPSKEATNNIEDVIKQS